MADIIERARRYVAQMDPAIDGSGGHTATFKVAVALVKGFALSPEQALPLMEEYNARCEPPWCLSDLQHKLRSAEQSGDKRSLGYLLEGQARKEEQPGVAPEPRAERSVARYDLERLRVFSGACRHHIDRKWLAERSRIPVEWGARPGLALGLVSLLFKSGDKVLLFKRKWSQGDFGVCKGKSYRLSREKGVKAELSEIPAQSNAGMLMMAAPVDGKWRPAGKDKKGRPKFSRRNTACVTRFPYLVLESDDAPLDLWLRALALLELRIGAILHSGGRSVHTLVRVDARSKAEFDDCAKVVAAALEVIGADPQALKGLPMSRVPGVTRVETGKPQEIWYLDPEPGWGRLVDKRVRQKVSED
jgi:hypothetical protein